MNNWSKKFTGKKFLLSALVVLVWCTAHAFAATELYFSPGNIYPILNTNFNSYSSKLKVDAPGVLSYWADLFDQSQWSWQQYPNDELNVVTAVVSPSLPAWMTVQSYGGWNIRTIYPSPDAYNVWEYAGTKNAPAVDLTDQDIWQVNLMNSGTYYLTSAYLVFFTEGNHATKLNGTIYDSISWLNIYFRACPAVKDTVTPIFPNNQTWINTNPEFPDRQINRQYRDDFDWIFGLLDNTNPISNNNGWIDTPDFEAGNNFRPNAWNGYSGGITNQNGINSWSFVLEIKVATGRDNSIAQTARTSWGSTDTFTDASAGIAWTAWGKTWRYLDKNFTWDIDAAGYIADFGVEELVMISWYVEDRDMKYPWFNGTQTRDQIKGYSYRSGKNTTNFVYYFNQWMKPRFNTTTAWSYTHTPNCIFDLDQYQTGFDIKTISGYLRDDRAGIDTSTVEVSVTGTIADVLTGKIYTQWENLALNDYSFTGSGCRNEAASRGNTSSMYPGNGTTEVCDDGTRASTGNYNIVFTDTARTYDPEDPLYVTISYKDLKGKEWRPVTCSRWAEKAPRFVWSGFFLLSWDFLAKFSDLMVLSNYPYGALIKNIVLQLQDEWAGVDTSTIAWSINGNTLDTLTTITGVTIDLAYNSNIYTQVRWTDLWTGDTYPNISTQWYVWYLINGAASFTNYYDRLNAAVNTIPDFQELNHQLDFSQTGTFSPFTGYFAPEQDINLSLTFNDKDSDGWSGRTVYNPINITYTNNRTPAFRDKNTSNFLAACNWSNWCFGGDENTSLTTASYDDPVGNSLTGYMAVLFSGNGTPNENRIYPYDLTGDNYSEIGTIKQTPITANTTDNRAWVDSGNIVLTITWNRRWVPYTYVFTASNLIFSWFDRWDTWGRNNLNYFSLLSGHGIYFDRQSRWGSGPVPWRESRYTINMQAGDLKQPTANTTIASFTRDMENLSCQYLDRCNARLYFTYAYSWISEPVSPVVRTGVHPFLWQTLYVIASWTQIIYTGVNENYIACNGAGTLAAPIIIDFENSLLAGWETDPYTNYRHSELVVMDGMFELSGNVLTLK